ncbi:MAG: hypothetical protein IJK71_11535 [Clostridia bacterium]|nr:hypothetical protein [Clostridia bacterium]
MSEKNYDVGSTSSDKVVLSITGESITKQNNVPVVNKEDIPSINKNKPWRLIIRRKISDGTGDNESISR